MTRTETALSRFAEGFNCSQAVFAAFAGDLGLEQETALKIAAGFGGGMGCMGEACGAVTGAIMVLGLRHGVAMADREDKEQVYRQVIEFIQRFKSRNGTITCRELLRCDISTPEGLQRATDENVFTTMCPKFVRDAVEVLEEMSASLEGPHP
jgi:C_GCAxxG_C_C family probable redox protein